MCCKWHAVGNIICCVGLLHKNLSNRGTNCRGGSKQLTHYTARAFGAMAPLASCGGRSFGTYLSHPVTVLVFCFLGYLRWKETCSSSTERTLERQFWKEAQYQNDHYGSCHILHPKSRVCEAILWCFHVGFNTSYRRKTQELGIG